MARTPIPEGSFVSLGTPTVSTLYGVEGGKVRLFTGSTVGVDPESGHLLAAGDSVVVPANLAVSAFSFTDGVVMTVTAFG